jgi:predicted RNase H-like HicB family nuclease
VLLKHATGKTNEDCLTMIDEEQGLILKVIEAYSNWISKAYTVAESGN